jgi:hypothetical protein
MRRGKIGLGVFWVAILIGAFFLSPAHTQDYPDLSSWLKQWFRINLIFQDLHFSNIGVPPDRNQDVEKGTAYFVCTGLTPTPYDPNIRPVFSCDIHTPNEGGGWEFNQVYLNYVGGDASNFAGWSELSLGNLTNSFAVQIKKKKEGVFTGATVKTLGGYRWEIDDVSPERWVGTIKFSGTWVNTNTLCGNGKNSTLPPCSSNGCSACH